jgi:UDP-glucose 4-epimerase
MASRGSVIPLFHEQIINNLPVTITDPEMTRFMMTLEDAVDLVLFAFSNGSPGDIFVQKSPASTIGQLASVMVDLYKSNSEIKIIGTRHAEKQHETLLSKEEMMNAVDIGNYFKIAADNRDLNYNKYFSEGQGSLSNIDEYNSSNTYRLTDLELIALLGKIGYSGKIL